MSVLKTDFAGDVADIIVGDIQLKRATWYHFLGKTSGYEYGGTLPTVIGQAKDESDIRNDTVYYKKISSNSISKVIPRVEWQENTVYSRWDHTRNCVNPLETDVYQNSFYVVTQGADQVYRVYKCLDNNENRYLDNPAMHFLPGALSQKIKPTFTGVTPIRFLESEWYNSQTGYPTAEGAPNAVLGDGYMWKYMYEIPKYKLRQFGNSSFVPVQKAISDNFYNKGAVDNVIVLDGGSGYDNYEATTIVVTDTGHVTGSGAEISISSVSPIGAISAVTILGGSGYTAGAKISISSVFGVGAVLEPIITSGVITGVDIVNPGYGYETQDNVTVSVGGAKFGVAVAKEAGISADGKEYAAGEIIKVQIVDPGIGYTSAPSLSVANNASGVYPTGKFNDSLGGQNPDAIVECVVSDNKVVNVYLVDPGIGYAANADTTIVVAGDGTGAEFVPIVENGRIIEVVTQNAGEGYTSISLRASTSAVGVTPASFEAVINQQDFTSDQSYIEQLAIPGGLYAAKLVDPVTGISTKGSGYTDSQFVEVTVLGDGIGAKAEAIVYDGEIVDVRFTDPGFGYTYANLSFYDSQRENSNTSLAAATGFAIVPPIGGHGQNAPKELGASGVGIYASFRMSSALNYINQDYRLYGLLRAPKDVYDRPVKADESLQTYTVGISTNEVQLEGFFEKTLVMTDTQYGIQKFKVLQVNDTNSELVLVPTGDRFIPPAGELFLETNTLIRCTVTEIADTPTINRNSGDLVFYSYEQPFTFSENQGIIIKTFLNFQNISL